VISLADVEAAAARIEGVAHRTPVFTSRTLDERTGTTAFLKAENLQRIGAFKFRGAYNAITALAPAGVAAVSSGNHAQAVALSAALHGIPAVILMPDDAPRSKLEATRGYGAEVVTYGRYEEDRDALLGRLAEERGLTAIHPYDEPLVQAGQGTAALELLDQTGGLDALLVPLGGGGLLAGCATAAEGVRVIGVEPAAGDDFQRSLAAGERVRIPMPRTIADGQQIDIPGETTFPVIESRADSVVTVNDEEILDAMAFAFERMKLVLEPSGASALAALLTGRASLEGRVGVVLSGGNIAIDRFMSLMETRA
jgi:threonine dehydratase